MHRSLTAIGAAAIALLSAPAMAAQAQPLTYEMFEAAVPHLDLETCPAALAAENSFCRATLNHEEFHVFAFSHDGDQPMLGMRTYPAEGVGALLGEPLD